MTEYTNNGYRRWKPLSTAVGCILLLGGCTSYRPQPLMQQTALASAVDRLSAPAKTVLAPSSNGLSLDQIAILAVRNNPELKAQRKRLGVARAQLYSAALFPDPQLSANIDHPTGGGSGLVNAFGVGLNYDIIPLINRGARVDGAQQTKQKVNLELLWQEWQVSEQARSLAVRLASERERLSLLRKMLDLYRQRYLHSSRALARGDLTLDVTGTDLTAVLDMLSQIYQLEQTHNDTRHVLNLLLGLAPEVPLEICMPTSPTVVDAKNLQRELDGLARRRPDLLALQAGYRSQEAKVRTAVLSQFPSFGIGISRARDTSDVYTTGLNIGLTLPLFDRNRGVIAVERATREQLRQEYQARLDQARVDVDKLIRLQGIIAKQQRDLAHYLPLLKTLVGRARDAYQRGDIDALTFLNMEITWINKRQEQIGLNQNQWETYIALETVLALPGAGTPVAVTAAASTGAGADKQ